MAQVNVRLADGLQAIAQARNHTWMADEPLEDGGTDTGPTPTEMFLGSLGACIAMTAQLYARRKQWPLQSVEIALELERFRGTEYPGYTGTSPFVHEIREHIVFHGPLTDEQKARVKEIAGKCPVRRVLTSPTFFTELHPQSAQG